MNTKPLLFANSLLILAMLVVSAWIWPSLPDDARLPVHWNLDGEPDRYGSKVEALLAMPAIALLLTIVFLVLPYFDPRRKNLQQSAKLWNAAAIGTVLLIAAIHAFLVLSAIGQPVDVKSVLLPGIAGLFILLGNYLGKTRSNWFAGIRTPWTLSSDYAWEKTHRWAGRLFVLTGVVTLAAWFVADVKIATWVMIAAIVVTSLVSIVLSYIYWRNDPNRVDANGGA
jgi:uncharacterized membrane protein